MVFKALVEEGAKVKVEFERSLVFPKGKQFLSFRGDMAMSSQPARLPEHSQGLLYRF